MTLPTTTPRDVLRARLRDNIRMLSHDRTAEGAPLRVRTKNQGDVTRAFAEHRQKNADEHDTAKAFGVELVNTPFKRTLQ